MPVTDSINESKTELTFALARRSERVHPLIRHRPSPFLATAGRSAKNRGLRFAAIFIHESIAARPAMRSMYRRFLHTLSLVFD